MAAGPCPADTLHLEAKVDTSRTGQSWEWRLRHNGAEFAGGTATTGTPSGDFTVRRRTADRVGPDTIRLVATNLRIGETCDGTILLP